MPSLTLRDTEDEQSLSPVVAGTSQSNNYKKAYSYVLHMYISS